MNRPTDPSMGVSERGMGADAPIPRTLANVYARLRADDLPDETRRAARRHMLDTLGAAIRGARQPEPSATLAMGRALHGSGDVALWGRAEWAPPALAALVNGVAAHALELDDASGCDHSGAVVIPATLAALALAPDAVEGDALAAIVVGYDLGRRMLEAAGGYDAHNRAGWHSTGTCGVFGAAAAVCRLWRLSPDVTAHALGIAGSFASGNWSFLQDGAMTKRLHPGHAAAAGLTAASLARSGMSGPQGVFGASWGGFFHTYAPASAQPQALTAELGERWRIHLSSIKPYTSCRGTHAAVEATLQARATLSRDRIASVEVGAHPTIVAMCGGKEIRSLVDAQMSLPYAVSVAMLYGEAGIDRFTEAVRRAPDVLDWVSRVTVVEDTTVPSNIATRLIARTMEGGVAADLRVETPAGSWNRPLSDAAIQAKFDGLASPCLGTDDAQALATWAWSLGTEDLDRPLRPPSQLSARRNLRPGVF